MIWSIRWWSVMVPMVWETLSHVHSDHRYLHLLGAVIEIAVQSTSFCRFISI